MHQPAVTQVEFWGLHQTLARIGVPRWQAAQQEQIGQQMNVAGDSFDVDAEVTCQLGRVHHPALLECQHGPQLTQ